MVFGKARGVELQGSLALTNVADLLQFLHGSRKTGVLGLSRGIGGKKARLFFAGGELSHAEAGELSGLDALVEVLGWEAGEFSFSPGVDAPGSTMEMPLHFALMEAMRRRDEVMREREEVLGHHESFVPPEPTPIPRTPMPVRESEPAAAGDGAEVEASGAEVPSRGIVENSARERTVEGGSSTERSGEMAQESRSSTQVMEDLLKVPGIDAVVVVGRDGFVIESAGSTTRLNIDGLGAALAHAINSVEEMGGDLRIDKFQDLFIEYGRAVILCRPVGDAVAALVAPDASKLGIIRHKSKALFEELARYF